MSEFPVPGNGYRIRSRLGGGAWKVAYRASTTNGLQDVALLYFHREADSEEFAKEVGTLIRARSKPYAEYIAEIRGFLKGDDGRSFLIEELIVRPLDAIKPLRDVARFVHIARDLCRGLTCLHSGDYVHRDLKLDNCGLDRQDRAKIFDLGSVTSEPGHVEATILTRAPELFQKGKRGFRKHSDVWAMGATLFALRTGEYPFVLPSEAAARRAINEKMILGEIDQKEAILQKSAIDEVVASRAQSGKASERLRARVHENFRGDAERIMASMLSFEVGDRATAGEWASAWETLAIRLGEPAPRGADVAIGALDGLHRLVDAALAGEISFTPNQIERMVTLFEREENSVGPELRERISSGLLSLKGQLA